MIASLLTAGLLLPGLALANDERPKFGGDFSAGYLAGALLGPWPEPGIHGTAIVRYDAFTVPRSAGGPRLGLSLWGSRTVAPLQSASETADDGSVTIAPFSYWHSGILAGLRHDPAAPVTGIASVGFGRLDLTDYWDGPLALPTLTFEMGLRGSLEEKARAPLFIDGLIRAHWATARSGIDEAAFEEWWMVQAGLMIGGHLQ